MGKRNIFAIFLGCFIVIFSSNLFIEAQMQEIEEQKNYANEIKLLHREVSNLKLKLDNQQIQIQRNQNLQKEISYFKDSFYDKTITNVALALQGANTATNLVSVFAMSFTLLTLVLGFFGFREWKSIRNVRLDAEKNLKLVKHFNMGNSYVQGNLFSAALKEFQTVVELDEKNDIAHTQLGYFFMIITPPDNLKSKFHSERATELNPNNYVALLNLGVVMNRMGEKQEDILSIYLSGERVAMEKVADDMTIGKFKLFAGDCYKNLGDKVNAKRKYDEARPYFEKYKEDQFEPLANAAKNWLKQLKDGYEVVTNPNK